MCHLRLLIFSATERSHQVLARPQVRILIGLVPLQQIYHIH